MRRLRMEVSAACLLLAMVQAFVGRPANGQAASRAPGVGTPPAGAHTRVAGPRWLGSPTPADVLYIRRRFVLPAEPIAATLTVEATGRFVAYLNGVSTLAGSTRTAVTGRAVVRRLRKGANVLAIEVRRGKSAPSVAYRLVAREASKDVSEIDSDGRERMSRTFEAGWETPGFADRRWPLAWVQPETAPSRAAAAVGSPATATPRTGGPAPAALPDPSRIVRVWDIREGLQPGEDPYARKPEPGQRILLTTNVAAPADNEVAASAGFTLLQTDSDHLSSNEVAPGRWDFSAADAGRRVAVDSGFDWCYFPHFAFMPKWMQAQPNITRLRCLEHDQTVEALSPWDPLLLKTIGQGYAHLAQQYGPDGVHRNGVSALYLGVHGDYGEAGLLMGARVADPAQAAEWKARFHNLHDHLGWWCGDPMARAAFQNEMLRKYGSLEQLNAAWRTSFAKPGDVTYPLTVTDGSRRRWLDFVTWYLDSVGALTDGVCAAARKNFPKTLLMLPAGFGDENPRGGNDNSLIPKTAARYGVEVRSTHGGFKPFAENQATMLGRLASASAFYGAPFWTEPPSRITREQQVGRFFEAASYGCRGFFDWSDNIRDTLDVYYKYGRYLRVGKRIVDVAMLFPSATHLLRPNEPYPMVFSRGCTEIRDVLDYDIVDERMIRDGALDHYRVLVMWEGVIYEAATLDRIRDWVRAGGVLAAYDFGKFETVEGDQTAFKDLFGYAGSLTPTTPVRRFVPAMRQGVPARYRIDVGTSDAPSYIAGDWHDAETIGALSGRWTGALADLYLPVDPKKGCTLTIRASTSAEAAGRKREVLVNGQKIGDLDMASEPTYTFYVPPAALNGKALATVTIRCETWVPAELLKNSQDRRSLGVFVNYVQVEAGQVQPAITDPGPPNGRIETTIDLHRLRTEWARPLGKGWCVYYPARRAQLPGYYEVIRYLTYHLSELDATKQDAIPVDDSWDGIYATLQSDRALYYNPGAEAVTRTVTLPAEVFAGHPEVHAPADSTFTLTLEPHSISAISFTPAPTELLLQCEKFTDLGGLKPSTGAGFSPGQGLTHVLIPVGGSISTRFECDAAGAYRVYVRGVRRGAPAQADVLIDGAPLRAEAEMPALGAATFYAGTAALKRGVHTLTVRPLRGQDVRADFVVLTNDPCVAGYRFAVKPPARH